MERGEENGWSRWVLHSRSVQGTVRLPSDTSSLKRLITWREEEEPFDREIYPMNVHIDLSVGGRTMDRRLDSRFAW